GIVAAPEDVRLRRAVLTARGLDLAVPDRLAERLGSLFSFANALDAEGALLHDPAAAHGHVGIEHQAKRLLADVRIFEPVEAPDLVGTVVGAVAGPDAAVVNLQIEALAVV